MQKSLALPAAGLLLSKVVHAKLDIAKLKHSIANLEVALTQSGDFEFVECSGILDNPADDHTVGPFEPSLVRNTDCIVLNLVYQ